MKRAICAAAIVVVAFAVYLSNGTFLGSFDSMPNSLLTYNALERGRFDFDDFRDSYFVQLGGEYAFTPSPSGHLVSLFPAGAGMLAAPAYAVLYGMHRLRGEVPAISSRAFEPQRQFEEKLVAAMIAALAAAMFFLCACEFVPQRLALMATAIFAAGTPMWTVAAQGLWQHGPVNFALLLALYALLRAQRARDERGVLMWIAVAGIASGFLPVVRPTALLFTIALAAFATITYRGTRLGLFAATALAGMLPGLIWNLAYFHNPLGGYAGVASGYILAPGANALALAGLLVSPSRGLFVYAPVLLAAIAGFPLVARSPEPRDRLAAIVAIAAALMLASYSFYASWWGGFTYGPRFATDVVAIAVLLGAVAFDRGVFRSPFVRGGVVFLALYSVAVQAAGAYSGAAGSDWNAVPVSVDERPQRVWQIRDNQIERNVRALYQKTFAWDRAASPAYLAGYAAQVTDLLPGGSLQLRATIVNSGTVPIYGYASGVYRGQTRIDVRPDGTAPQVLFVRDDIAPGTSGVAEGDVAPTMRPGSYSLTVTPVLVGEPQHGKALRTTLNVRY